MLSVVVASRLHHAQDRTLSSLASQQPGTPDFEVVVVADGADERDIERLRRRTFPFDLRVVPQVHSGLAAARNRGAAASGRDLLVFLDDDIVLEPTFISAVAGALSDGADVVLPRILIGDWVPDTRYSRAVRAWELTLQPGDDVHFNSVFFAACGVRRQPFDAVGGFDPSFTEPGRYGNEDFDLGVRLRGIGARIVRIPEAVRTDLVTDERVLLTRARLAGRNDTKLARKHPELASHLFERRTGASTIDRCVSALLRRCPRVGAGASALHAAYRAIHAVRPQGRSAARLWHLTRSLRYWQGVHEEERTDGAGTGGAGRHHPRQA